MTRSALAMLFATAVLIAACGGATPTATSTAAAGTPTGAATATGGTAATPSPAATATPGATNQPPVGDICAAFPTIDPTHPVLPSFAPDPGLEAHFPAQIDGSAPTKVQSGSFAAFACLGGPQALAQLQNTAAYDLLKLTFGTAKYNIDNDSVDISGFRLPGGDGSQIVATLAQLAAVSGTGVSEQGTLGQGTAGGKSVITYTDKDGKVSYGLVIGDSLIFAGPITQSQADKIFAAIR